MDYKWRIDTYIQPGDKFEKMEKNGQRKVNKDVWRQKETKEDSGGQRPKEAKTATKPVSQRATKTHKWKQSKRQRSHAGRQMQRQKGDKGPRRWTHQTKSRRQAKGDNVASHQCWETNEATQKETQVREGGTPLPMF